MRISHSALQCYLECGYKYFLQYFWRLRPSGYRSALVYGSAVDTGLNTLLETRDIDLAIDKFKNHWRYYLHKDVKYSKSDFDEHLISEDEKVNSSKEQTWLSLNRKGIILLQEFNAQVMPRIKRVIKVQIDQVVPNDIGDELIIKTDFICEWEDGRIILFDNKTSSVKYEEDSVKKSEQLAIYYETLKEEYKLDAAGYIVIPKALRKKKLPAVEISVIIDQIDQETFNKTLESYDTVLNEIKGANFKPNHKACIGKFGRCDYYDLCHKGLLDGLEESKGKGQ